MPQKKKPMVMTAPKDSAGPFKRGSSLSKKGKNFGSFTGTLSGSGKSVPNESRKNAKYAARDSSQPLRCVQLKEAGMKGVGDTETDS